MSPLDLDAWQRAADYVRNCDVPEMRVVTADPEEVDALLAELRVARDSATAFRTLLSTTICEPCYLQDWADSSTCDCSCHADADDARTTAQAALAAYDKVTGEVPAP